MWYVVSAGVVVDEILRYSFDLRRVDYAIVNV